MGSHWMSRGSAMVSQALRTAFRVSINLARAGSEKDPVRASWLDKKPLSYEPATAGVNLCVRKLIRASTNCDARDERVTNLETVSISALETGALLAFRSTQRAHKMR